MKKKTVQSVQCPQCQEVIVLSAATMSLHTHTLVSVLCPHCGQTKMMLFKDSLDPATRVDLIVTELFPRSRVRQQTRPKMKAGLCPLEAA